MAEPRVEPDERLQSITRQWNALIRDITVFGDPDNIKGPLQALDEFRRQLELTAIAIHDQGSYSKLRIADGAGITKQILAQWFTKHKKDGTVR